MWVLPGPAACGVWLTSPPRSARENRRCRLVRLVSSGDRLPCGRQSASSGSRFVELCQTLSKTYFNQQRPMVHAADGGITQNFRSSGLFACEWTKDVINAAIVDCGVAGSASEIVKVAQNVTVRLAVMFQVVSIKVCRLGSFEFEVEIT